MSVALRPASVMARASLQQPAQAQTDPHKKMNLDNINNTGVYVRHLEYRYMPGGLGNSF